MERKLYLIKTKSSGPNKIFTKLQPTHKQLQCLTKIKIGLIFWLILILVVSKSIWKSEQIVERKRHLFWNILCLTHDIYIFMEKQFALIAFFVYTCTSSLLKAKLVLSLIIMCSYEWPECLSFSNVRITYLLLSPENRLSCNTSLIWGVYILLLKWCVLLLRNQLKIDHYFPFFCKQPKHQELKLIIWQ